MMICTCRMTHEKITHVDDDGDTIITESGWRCSYSHCCDQVDHEWSHLGLLEKSRAEWP